MLLGRTSSTGRGVSDFGYRYDGNSVLRDGELRDGQTGSHECMCILSPCAKRRFGNNGREIDETSPFYLNEWIHMFMIVSTWEKKEIEKKKQDHNAAKPITVGFHTIDDESRVDVKAY